MAGSIFLLNDNLIEVLRLQDEGNDTYLNDAIVTVTLKNSAGQNIAGETWPLALSYVAGSSGDYRGTLKSTLTLPTAGQSVVAEVSADGGSGKKGFWKISVGVKERTG